QASETPQMLEEARVHRHNTRRQARERSRASSTSSSNVSCLELSGGSGFIKDLAGDSHETRRWGGGTRWLDLQRFRAWHGSSASPAFATGTACRRARGSNVLRPTKRRRWSVARVGGSFWPEPRG